MSTAKDEARKLLDQLPDDSTWNDILYASHVRAKVERGPADLRAGRTLSQEEVERKWLR